MQDPANTPLAAKERVRGFLFRMANFGKNLAFSKKEFNNIFEVTSRHFEQAINYFSKRITSGAIFRKFGANLQK